MNPVKNYWQDRLILVSGAASILINIVLWIWLFGKFGLGREIVPVHFNIVSGIDLTGPGNRLYQLPAAGLVILSANFALGRALHATERMTSYFLAFGAFTAQIYLLLGVFWITAINS